jgi:hypothetical protein
MVGVWLNGAFTSAALTAVFIDVARRWMTSKLRIGAAYEEARRLGLLDARRSRHDYTAPYRRSRRWIVMEF